MLLSYTEMITRETYSSHEKMHYTVYIYGHVVITVDLLQIPMSYI